MRIIQGELEQKDTDDSSDGSLEVEQSTSEAARPGPSKKPSKEGDQCTICSKRYVNVRWHILTMHIQNKDKLPLHRLEPLVEMSRHGDKVRGERRTCTKDGKKKVYAGRRKEICPMCDRVQQFLTTHLERVHKLDRTSEKYRQVVEMARTYEGRRKELKWDVELHKNKKRKVPDSDSELEPTGAKTPSKALLLLGEGGGSPLGYLWQRF